MAAPTSDTSLDGKPAECSPQTISYWPLKGTEIRYLLLMPWRESVGLIECTLHHVPLESGKYSALSYTWGDPTVTETILVDNRPFQATTNLVACLKSLNLGRAKFGWPLDEGLRFWVDAVCINQYDISERNAQILRMRNIYKNSIIVIIWLGPHTEYTELAINRLTAIAAEVDKLPEDAMSNPGSYMIQLTDIARRHPTEFVEHIDSDTERATQEGLKDFFYRPWWRRTWILQEVSAHLNPSPLFLCGDYSINKLNLLKYQQVSAIGAIESGVDAITASVKAEYTARGMALTIREKELLNILQETRTCEATDPRDKVYGILGLTTDFSSGSQLVPDYSLSVQEVYTSTVKANIEKYNNLDILSHCGYTKGGLDLPSWVPDWRSAPETLTGVPLERYVDPPNGDAYDAEREIHAVYSASGKTYPSALPLPIIVDRELHLQGFVLDSISTLLPVSDYTIPSRPNVEKLWMPDSKDVLYTQTGETMEKAYLHTIVADFTIFTSRTVNPPSAATSRGHAMVWPNSDASTGDGSEEASAKEAQAAQLAQFELMKTCHLRRLAYTQGGLMGLVPAATRVGDVVGVLMGGQMLYVLRTAGGDGDGVEGGRFELVGEAYFHGVMDGEAMRMVESGERRIGKIVLK